MKSGFPAIQKLPREVINRIAAGEVVQRPSAALKELLENSLDAQSTSIAVTVQEGGLESLQVSDDGAGVRYADLPLLCERHATSKLRAFEDLQSISSFGFRGEALASISYVSRVSVTTRRRVDESAASTGAATEVEPSQGSSWAGATGPIPGATAAVAKGADGPLEESSLVSSAATVDDRDGRVAWRCVYMDGKLIDPPQPCAGNYGTIIRAERMFYNAHVRRAALKPAEEWRRLLDVVSRYALAFPEVGFACHREGGGAGGDGLVFPKNSSTLENMRLLLGGTVASHLRFIYHTDSALMAETDGDGQGAAVVRSTGLAADTPDAPLRDGVGASGPSSILARVRAAARRTATLSGACGEGVFTLHGYTSDATLLYRKGFLALFVNDRLVESAAVRRAVEAVYSSVLTGGHRPVTVLLLSVPADRLDVNVHPTKKEVHFLDEEAVVGRVAELIRAALVEAAAERQVDVASLGRLTTLSLQAAVRYGGGEGGGRAGVPTRDAGECSSAARGVRSFQQQQQGSHRPGGALGTHPTPAAAPSSMVRVEAQRGALDVFLQPIRKPVISTMSTTATTASTASSSGGPVGISSPVELVGQRGGEDAAQREGEGVSHPTAAADWASVLASVRPVVESAPVTLVADEPSLATGQVPTVGGGGLGERAQLPHLQETASHPTSQLHVVGSDNSGGGGALPSRPSAARGGGDADDDDEDDVCSEADDVMREFKRARVERNDGGPTRALPPPLAPLLLDGESEDDGNAVQVVVGPASGPASDREAAAPLPSSGCSLGGDLDGVCAGGPMLAVPQLEDHILTSVASVVDRLVAATSEGAQTLMESLSYVGVVDGLTFLAQSGTTLVAVDTLRLVREAVRQRIFLRWAQPSLPRAPCVLLLRGPGDAVRIYDAILFALYHDASAVAPSVVAPSSRLLRVLRRAATGLGWEQGRAPVAARATDPAADMTSLDRALLSRTRALLFHRTEADGGGTNGGAGRARPPGQPTSACRKYARVLVSRLTQRRDMLEDYFGIRISSAGELLAVPSGLNTAWPPCVRAVPLFLWLLAETVPFPGMEAGAGDDAVRPVEMSAQDAVRASQASAGAGHSAPTADAAAVPGGEETQAEIACFERIAGLIADVLYGMTTSHLSIDSTEEASDGSVTQRSDGEGESEGRAEAQERQREERLRVALGKAIQFGLLPCLKNRSLFLPPAQLLSDGTLQSVVTLESLYRVFERC